ncbi:MAG: 30S ribosomal protein S1 [Candidatus Neomarinimicrobiota bacterium]|nr:MAG: 30S ribosomal protein S1 [Candidatus Neomarinimicrobiota bacterium]
MTEQELKPVAEAAEAEAPSADVSAEETSAPATSADTPTLPNYLAPDLFKDVKTVTADELEPEEKEEVVPEEVQQKYVSTFSDISENEVITGRVIGMNEKEILVDIGFKSEGIIDRSEFAPEDMPEIGQTLEVYLEKLENQDGNTILSKTKADFMRRWKELKEYYENGTTFTGKIVRRIKGGMVVDVGIIQAFLPGSQIDVRPVKDFDQYLDKEIELKIVKFNEARKNIVVSHKAILEDTLKEQREALFQKIKVGEIMEGRVKNITDFGVFIDLGGLDGLLHITDLSWGRVNHPSEIVKMDETLTVKIIDYDEEKKRVSLGLKQLTPHPWDNIEDKYPVGTVVKGKIVSMTNYGAFIEIEPGVEGLIHVSEMSWTRHVKNPSELYSMGDIVEAQVLSIDPEERKISLGVKQLLPDPWDKIEEKYMVGTVHKGHVSNLTQFGAFVELEEGVDGLIHVSDLSWTRVVRHPKEILEKGQEVEVRVLEVSRDNRRISLGLKQVQEDPWPEIIKAFDTGSEVTGKIIRILDKGIIVELDHDVEGIIPFAKRSKRERKSLIQNYKIGEEISGIVMEVKPEEKKIVLFREDLSAAARKKSHRDEVQDYLRNQESPAAEKIEIPDALKQTGDDPEPAEE